MRQILLGVAAIFVSASLAHGYEIPESYRQKYRDLISKNPAPSDDGSLKLGDGRLFKRGNLRILYLKGDTFEMAFQHGRLLREDVRQGALPQTALIVRNSVLNSFPVAPALANTVTNVIYRLYSGNMVNHAAKSLVISEDQFLADAYGMSEGSGVPVDTVVSAFTGPETLQVILGERLAGGSQLPPPLSVNECTDFSVKSSRGDGLIIGRNTDYPLNGSFDRFPTVVYYNPTDGDQKFMSITSAGLHTAGVVGLNESGLYIGIHTIPTGEVSKAGFPAFFIGERVLRKARNFNDAIRIFASMKPAAGWSYTLVSLREKRSASIEFNNRKFAVRESREGWHIQTNHYLAETMMASNLDLNATINQDTRARYKRVSELLAMSDHAMDSDGAVRILSDKTDPYSGRIRGLGNVIAVHTTLTSAVVDSYARKIFVATGTAPVSMTTFVEVPFVEDFDPAVFNNDGYSSIENSLYHTMHPELSRAEQLYIDAKTAYETELNPAKAASILKRVVLLDRDNPGYQFVLALMHLKSGDFALAEEAFKLGAVSADEHYRLASQYFLGRIYAHQGERHLAESFLVRVITLASPAQEAPLLRATQKALARVKKLGSYRLNHKSVAVFMPEADVVQY